MKDIIPRIVYGSTGMIKNIFRLFKNKLLMNPKLLITDIMQVTMYSISIYTPFYHDCVHDYLFFLFCCFYGSKWVFDFKITERRGKEKVNADI